MQGFVRRSMALGAGLAVALLGGTAALAQGNIQMIQAKARLEKALDAKKAKQGQEFTAKLLAGVRFANGQQLPEGAVLEGHIDQVEPSQHKGKSTMTVTIDKVRLKDGEELPVKATIVGMSEPALAAENNMGGGMPGQGSSQAAGNMGGMRSPTGGSMGGDRGSNPGMNGMQPGMGMPQQESESGPGGMQRSGVPGVMLTSSIHDQASATFTSQKRNVHVPGGVELELGIAVVPKGVHLH
jgi:hypothetical protein